MGDAASKKGGKGSSNGLTSCIGASIHWPPAADGSKPSEKDMIDIQNFIETLSRVALSVARREKASG